jgi:cobalt-zinc-cadmium efflux system membrane fusion protein
MRRSLPGGPAAVVTAIVAVVLLGVAGFMFLNPSQPSGEAGGEHKTAAAEEFERGPHRGRMLRDGPFAIEVTIFEDGVEPEFHLYVYRNDKPVPPGSVQVTMALHRLGGKVDRFTFTPVGDYLKGSGVVIEPHSFDVVVQATYDGTPHQWKYASYEGRTVITTEAARQGGIKTAMAGPASIAELIELSGRVEVTPEGKAEVRAVYPGRILAMRAELGQPVRKGQVLARVESSYSLQAYNITAPISGVIVEKNANVGGVAGEAPLFVIADASKLHAEFFVYPRDAERIRVGQTVELRTLNGEIKVMARVEAVLPTADFASQTLMAHVEIPVAMASRFRPGMAVEGSVTIARQDIPLAVRTSGLQPFRDFTVVYARVGNTYEVRMLELGRRTPEWTEVLGGLEPGTEYVTDGAFLIRADIDKSGASHDH